MYSGLKDSEKIAHMRRQQIDSIKIFNDKITEVTEGSEYKVEFSANGNNFGIFVNLSKDFPLEKPVVKIEPPVNHPWVNASNGEIVAAPGLLKFSIHSDLGRVIQAIVREFELRPPSLIESYQKELKSNDNSHESTAGTNFGSSNGDSTIYSHLNCLSLEHLQKMNSETAKLEEFIEELPTTTDLNKCLEEELAKVERLALDNLDRENELASLKSQVNQLTGQLSEAFDEYRILSSEYSTLCEKFDPNLIRGSLVQAIAKVDEESEKIAEGFLKGDIDLETFLSDYSSHRFLSHSRKFKAENLGQQLSKLQQSRF